MNDPVSDLSFRIWGRLKDYNASRRGTPDDSMYEAINDVLLEFAADDLIGKDWVPNFITLVADTHEYNKQLAEYGKIIDLRRQFDGQHLHPDSPTNIDRYRETGGSGRGWPTNYCIIDSAATYSSQTAQASLIRVWPIPGAAHITNLDAFVQQFPDKVDDPNDVVHLSRLATAALECKAASILFDSLPDDEKDRLRLPQTFGQTLGGQGSRFMALERRRLYENMLGEQPRLEEA